MVGIIKHIISLAATAALGVAALSAQTATPAALSLDRRQSKQLQLRLAAVGDQLAAAKASYAVAPNDSIAQRIYYYEHQIAEMSGAKQKIDARIDAAVADSVKVAQTAAAFQNKNKAIIEMFNIAVRRYGTIEQEVDGLLDDYATFHNQAKEASQKYADARNMAQSNKYYNASTDMISRAKQQADKFADRSEGFLRSKEATYLKIADTLGLASLKNDYLAKSHDTESLLPEIMGRYSDPDIAMYPMRKADLMYLEVKLARELSPESKVDSLLRRMAAIKPSTTMFEPLQKISRADAQFAEAIVRKQPKYAKASSIPAISVPREGEIYSILLGTYSQLPPMSALHNAAPLFSERREGGKTSIYAGLYPTAAAAADGIALMRKIGFKQPTVVMWRNGIRRDDYVDRTSVSTERLVLYKVQIGTNTLSDELRQAISKAAPRKEISKVTADDGSVNYTVGTFGKKSEADALIKALKAIDSSLGLETIEIVK